MAELTWQDIDRLQANRQSKKRECTDRLARILSKEFSAGELRFVWSYGGGFPSAILTEAFEIARNSSRR